MENRTNIVQRRDWLDLKTVGTVNGMVKIAILSVIAYIIMFFETPVFFFPPFLKMDISDLPALLGGFAIGPMAGILIQFIKNLIHLVTKTTTGGVGEFANFVVGSALILPAALTYSRVRTKKSAMIGMTIGVILMAVISAFANYFIMLPFYSKVIPMDQIIALSNAANGIIKDKMTLVLYGVIPFNILKGIILTLFTGMLYKKLSPILKIKKA